MIGQGGAIKAIRAVVVTALQQREHDMGSVWGSGSGAVLGMAVAAAIAFGACNGAAAQGLSDSEALLSAIEEQRANDAVDLVTRRGRAIVNIRGYAGATPLTLAMRKRVPLYVNFLLNNGADPNLADKQGDTALIIAARSGFMEGISSMLGARAAVNAANRQGETALILAVQGNHLQVARRLLEAGADPLRTDNIAGLSARDYAARDRRSTEMSKLIESVRPKQKIKFIAGPVLR